MLVKISSKNPHFSYAIAKNPNSPPKIKGLRSGYLFGWYSSPSEYCVRFIDSPDENSFKKHQFDEFSYLDTEAYSSPAIPSRVIGEFFSKVITEHDLEYECEFKAYSVNIGGETLGRVKNTFEGVEIEEVNGSFDITVRSTSISRLLKEADLFFMFICCKGYNYFVDFNEKYLKRMVEVDAPYFVRYVIKNALVRNSVNKWEAALPFINTSEKWKLNIQKFNNQEVRRIFAKRHLTGGRVLVDVGCGTGQFMGLAALYEKYIGVDPDEKTLEKAKKKAAAKRYTNCELVQELPEIGEDYDVLITEVIEHLTPEEQLSLIQKVKNAKKVVLTTPNKEFNQFYGIESRREDHLNELSLDELRALCGDGTYYELGDMVNGISTISGFVYAKAVN